MTTAYDAGDVPEILVRHRLRIAREHRGLEQAELADLIGVSRNTISNAENGRNEPRKILLNAWALACGVPVKWIENGGTPGRGPSGPDGAGKEKLPRLDSNQEPSD
ncbi:helix-turn-helix transcriptional regulator [Mycobacteroides chelonae]|jgi:transcriptional regulator with XRE-family HTH domain|nr:helix-turn-helix transcriptional regulator [Mycobacteroides chelonae]